MARPVPYSTKSRDIRVLARLAFIRTARQRFSRSIKWKWFAIGATGRSQFPARLSQLPVKGKRDSDGWRWERPKFRRCQGRGYFEAETAWRLGRAAAMVRSMSSSVCAAETNHASNCEGGSRKPCASISWKKAVNRVVSDFLAPA